MNTAVNDQDEGAGESMATELPALLVAGGSCSRRCRSQRAIEEAALTTRSQVQHSNPFSHAPAGDD
jgi:hypothetical protein